MTIELVVPLLPCAMCAHAVVCAVKPTLERQARDWQLMPSPDPLITVTARLTVECAEYLPLVEVKPHVVLEPAPMTEAEADAALDNVVASAPINQPTPPKRPTPVLLKVVFDLDPAGKTKAELRHQALVASLPDLGERIFAAVREDPTRSYGAIAKLVGLPSNATVHHRLNHMGELPADIVAWRESRALARAGLPKAGGHGTAAEPEPFVVEGSGEAARKLEELLFPTVVTPIPRPAGWSPDCKSPADWTDWREANARKGLLNRLDRPCDDCPLAYASEKLKQGRCNGIPVGGWPAVAQ